MAASSKSRSNTPVLKTTFSLSHSSTSSSSPSFPPSDPFSPLSSPPSTFASSSSYSSSLTSSLFNRPSSPTRVNLSPTSSSVTSFRISLNNRSLSPTSRASSVPRSPNFPEKFTAKKKTCMCSPTTHPGSFRCAIHRNNGRSHRDSSRCTMSCPPMRLNLRRSAMTNSLVRIGTVEGDWVRRALTALIRPSSHQQRRRHDFQPRPSRLSVVCTVVGCDP